MNLVIDIGNTFVKYGVFSGNEEIYSDIAPMPAIGTVQNICTKHPELGQAIISATGNLQDIFVEKCRQLLPKTFVFSAQALLPYKLHYNTPQTIGLDRLAAVAGAQTLFPAKNILAIDMGTAITFDLLTSGGIFKGGNISPGMNMRFAALNHFTHRLPLVNATDNLPILGKSTEQAMQCGVINGIIYEIEGTITEISKNYEDLTVILTGGDAKFFDNKLKKTIFVVQNLVRTGLNTILNYNAPNI
ncbi:MAG: type III pantothenate kinase [Bacteroidales bacterium]|nr:type III pantothenate kinase [Bacteroidales bacterium]